jgi:hypothetical protein
MLSDIRVPIRGQTIESLVAAHWLRNPWPTWDDAAKAVFTKLGFTWLVRE